MYKGRRETILVCAVSVKRGRSASEKQLDYPESQSKAKKNPAGCAVRWVLLYEENHSLGEWFKRRLLPIMRTIKTPFAKIEVRSGNCTNKQREVIQNERQ